MANPERYDGKLLSVDGTVTGLRSKVSRKGNAYYTFRVSDGRAAVMVFSFGTPSCSDGRQTTVEGQFLRVKQVSGYTFYDQIDARRVNCGR